jgi:hypothetical protein
MPATGRIGFSGLLPPRPFISVSWPLTKMIPLEQMRKRRRLQFAVLTGVGIWATCISDSGWFPWMLLFTLAMAVLCYRRTLLYRGRKMARAASKQDNANRELLRKRGYRL